ncbi:MAG: DnaJ domain-containing protein, partial [Spirochaetota bacterium]
LTGESGRCKFTLSTMGSDPFEVLGVDSEADDEEIRKAYRRLAKQEHPDTAGSGGEESFRRVNDAYEEIKSARRRQERTQTAPRRRTYPWAPEPTGFGHLSTLFDRFFGFSPFSGRRQGSAGEYRAEVRISANAARSGTTLNVGLPDGNRRIDLPPEVEDGEELIYQERDVRGTLTTLRLRVRVG